MPSYNDWKQEVKTFIFARPRRLVFGKEAKPDNVRIDIMLAGGKFWWSYHGESSSVYEIENQEPQTIKIAAHVLAVLYDWNLVGETE